MKKFEIINDFHPTRNAIVRMNEVCPYFTMFPLSFPYEKLKHLHQNARILDPFCGRGTTNFAARLHDLNSTGIDSNPVAVAIAQAKFIKTSINFVIKTCQDAIEQTGPLGIPRDDFWEYCYHKVTLKEICSLRTYFLKKKKLSKTDIVLRAITLGLLHGPLTKEKPTYFSNQMPRTYSTKPKSAVSFWKKRKMNARYVSVIDAISRRAEYLLKYQPESTEGFAILADSRDPKIYEKLGKFDFDTVTGDTLS
jgi:hypothetical protein